MAKRLLFWSAFLLLCLGIVTVRVVFSSRGLLRSAKEARAAGEIDRSMRDFGRSARMYTPGNPYADQALKGLLRLAEEAMGRGEKERARRCLQEARSAILSTRSFYTPHADLLAEIEARLAVVPPGWPASPAEAPGPLTSLVILLGAGMFIGAAVMMILQGRDVAGKWVRRRMALFSLLGALGFGFFLLGLWRA